MDSTGRLLVTLAVMSATLMQVLDTTIVNVALPHMQGQLGATTDQVSWVLTSYLVASAVLMPLTGYFADVLGRKRYLLICIGGFVAASALCGLSMNLPEIVAFRLLQGVFGAALVPLSQAIMADAYPPQERGRAMAIWGLGVMVGPVLGPTLGGWLTDVASWRWTFYINVPVGALSFLLASRYVAETPVRSRRMDWTGLGLVSTGIAATQYFLDRGNQQDWFSAPDIRVAAALGMLGLAAFVAWSLWRPGKALFDVRIFTDRNFGMSCIVMALLGLGLFGGMVVQPVLIEGLLGYPIVTTGLVMAPRGVASAISMIVVGRLVGRVDARILIITGLCLSAAGSYAMTGYSLDVDTFALVWPAALQGLGMGLVFVPLSAIAYATLDRARTAEAAGLFSLVRTMGASVGISLVTTLMTRQAQVLWNQLGAHVNLYDPDLASQLGRLNLSPSDPLAIALLAREVGRQAQMIAMLDAFKLITWSFLVMLPVALLLRRAGNIARPASPPAKA
jgi:DHA2 family multidrug resistance protein